MPVPPNIKGAIERYIKDRLPPGHFTTAVLENNLREAFLYADRDSLANMLDIVSYVYNTIPSIAWGSPQRVKDWLSGETQERYGYKVVARMEDEKDAL